MKLTALIFILILCSLRPTYADEDLELKTKDMSVQGLGQDQISAEQLSDLQKQVETLKSKQKEANKALEELDQE